MRLLLYLTAFSLLAMPSLAAAQHMNSPEAPCRNTVTTSDMVACFVQEYKSADQEMNAYYARLHAVLNKDTWVRLQSAQRLWLKFRDANCDAEYSLYDGGSAGPTVKYACLEELTRKRTADLKAGFNWTIEKWEN